MSKSPKNNSRDLAQIIKEADAATKVEDLEAAQVELRRLLSEGFVEQASSERAFAPAVEMTEVFRSTYMAPSEGGAESASRGFFGNLAIDAANALSNAERRVAYRLKVLFGFKGLRLVEEGDSWTQYPIFLEDIVDHLSNKDDIAVFSLGAAGDLVADMAQKKDYLRALRQTKAPAMLLSGGGNDLFGDLEVTLVDYTDGATPASLINEATFGPIFRSVMDSYDAILSDVASDFPQVTVFGHGYDLPFPREDGKKIGQVLANKGISFDIGREVLGVIMDRFNAALAELATARPNFEYCDLRGEVDRGKNSWHNELHPKNAGYERAAAVIENRIRSRTAATAGTAVASFLSAATGGVELSSGGKQTVVIDPGHGGTASLGGSSANNATGPNGTLEKHLTLDVAKRTRDILEDRGFTVLLTRETDVNSSLRSRAAVAKDNAADAFVSLHFNGSTGHNAQGTETFVHASLGSGGGRASKSLCLAVQAEMVAALGLTDRNALHPGGIKFGGFGVINPAKHASRTAVVLHEVSFLDRADEEARLSTVSYRRKVATALADGIETYLRQVSGVESTSAPHQEMEDGFQMGVSDPFWEPGDGVQARPFMPLSQMDADTRDISNGHMIGATGSADDFLTALAASEARFVQQNVGAADEGNEPSEIDPAVQAVFEGMSADVRTNEGLLRGLFGGVESSGFDHAAFEAFIQSLGLRYFSAGEFLVQGGQNSSGACAGKNTLPPQSRWPRLANTARMIDEIRHRLNAPVFISSAYRSPAYNTCIGGATRSQHMNFNALDWRCSVGSPSDWFAVATQVRASSSSYAGFIKQYGTFVHVDTRDA